MAIKIAKKIIQLTALHTAFAFSAAAAAGTVVVKPGSYVNSSEFGGAVARSGNYTVVSASLETVAKPGEPVLGGGIGGQGVVYLFNGTNSNPERRYQFMGNENFRQQAGAQVAISTKWLAFTAAETTVGTVKNSAVYIVGKVNGQWPQCPTSQGVLECSSMVKANGSTGSAPITKIEFTSNIHASDMNVAISDDYLVMANQATNELFIHRYDASQTRWIKELDLPADNSGKRQGASIAIDGDRVAISSPKYAHTGGSVYVYKRSTSGVWNIMGAADGNVYGRNFGHKMDMHSGNLVIASGDSDGDHRLTFFRVRSDGALIGHTTVGVGHNIFQVAVSGNTAAYTLTHQERALTVLTRNTTTNEWHPANSLHRKLYLNPNNSSIAYSASDPIDLVGDDLVLGWRAYNSNGGAFIHEKVSRIDLCKTVANLVSNCSFDNNSGAGWQFLSHQGASASVTYNNGQLNATIHNPGTVHWHIQARTAVNLKEAGTYQIQFRAKAPTFRDITVNLGHNGNADNNWVSYGQQSFRPGPDWTHYIYEFYGVPVDANAFLDFNLGNSGNTSVTIDGVSLTKLD